MAQANPAAALPPANDDRIAFFDLQRQRARLESEIKAGIDQVLGHGQFILGPEVDQLEAELASFAGVDHAIAVSSGRDALMIALMAMGIQAGDAVFVPAFTFAATAGAVASVGARPVFVDVDPATFNMDPADLDRAIDEVKAAGAFVPRVVMPVDLYGLPAEYAAIAAVAVRHGIVVLSDAAQSFGSTLNGAKAGAMAPISATSFYPTKPLGCYGDGGAVLTEDAGLADAVRAIRSHGRQGTGDEASVLGITGRLDTIQAAVLLAKLTVFEDELSRRREIAAQYDAALGGRVTVPTVPTGAQSANALYTIRVGDRDAVRDRLAEAGIGTGVFYRLALHQHPAFKHFDGRHLPVSEALAGDVLSLPVHPDLSDQEVDRVIATLLDAVPR